jgi:hypothetical protein
MSRAMEKAIAGGVFAIGTSFTINLTGGPGGLKQWLTAELNKGQSALGVPPTPPAAPPNMSVTPPVNPIAVSPNKGQSALGVPPTPPAAPPNMSVTPPVNPIAVPPNKGQSALGVPPTPSAAPPNTGVTPPVGVVFPTAVSPKYTNESAGTARMHTCRDQYNANKATNANGGLDWIIEKGGGYYSECNKRLK